MTIQLPDLAAIPKIITCTVEGILEPDDLLLLRAPIEAAQEARHAGEGPRVVKAEEDPFAVKVLKEKHHMVARCVAGGMTAQLTATICNYDAAYLTGVLIPSPAMQELIAFYRMRAGNAHEVIGEKLRDVGMRAVDQLSDKLDEGNLSAAELASVAKLGLDRSGHGPQHKHAVVSETHVYDHAQLQELNRQARAQSKEFIRPVPKALPAPSDEGDEA